MRDRPDIVVVGSVNLDLVARVERLPVAGETVTGAELARFPGGKGANQALAARRLGAAVRLIAAIGRDAEADLALALLKAEGVDLDGCTITDDVSTGVALIAVGASGENQIVVAPGANRRLAADRVTGLAGQALICQLETPAATLERVTSDFDGLVCVNLAPAMAVPPSLIADADLVVVNETEAAFYGERLAGSDVLVAETRGAAAARLSRRGRTLATATPPAVVTVDTTGAGDAFTAALTIALVEGMDHQSGLEFACAAGALATTGHGAQPALPRRIDVDALLAGS